MVDNWLILQTPLFQKHLVVTNFFISPNIPRKSEKNTAEEPKKLENLQTLNNQNKTLQTSEQKLHSSLIPLGKPDGHDDEINDGELDFEGYDFD